MTAKGPIVRRRRVYCAKCDARYTLGFNRQNRPVGAGCPKCKCATWAIRPRAEVEALVEQWKRLAYKEYLSRLKIVPSDASGVKDSALEEAALLGLYAAARQWDTRYRSPKTGKGVQFNTYATWSIRSWMVRCIEDELKAGVMHRPERRVAGHVVSVRYHVRLSDCPEDMQHLAMVDERAADPFDVSLAVEHGEILRKALARLYPSQRQVLELRFYGGKSVKEIAGMMGRTDARVRQIQERGLVRLHREVRALGLTVR